MIGGIAAGVVLFLLILTVTIIYLRRRTLARRRALAPSYAYRTWWVHEDPHWTERPMSPIVPLSGEWEDFSLPGDEKEQEQKSKESSQCLAKGWWMWWTVSYRRESRDVGLHIV